MNENCWWLELALMVSIRYVQLLGARCVQQKKYEGKNVFILNLVEISSPLAALAANAAVAAT